MSARRRSAGFTLLPVILAMTLIGAIAFLLNRANGLNGETIAGRADRERARYAAEAGLQAANFTVQKTGCVGPYPVAAAPLADGSFAGAAYSAYASAAIGSPLTLTATGSYNGASVTLTRSNVYVYQSGVKSFSYQPTGPVGVDTWVDPNNPSQNRGNDEDLVVGTGGPESLIRFDMSFLPTGSRIVSTYDTSGGGLAPGAVLELFKTGSGSGASGSLIDVHAIPRARWTEGTGSAASGATWDTYDGGNTWASVGGRYDPRVISSSPYQNNSGWQTFDVTDAARAWMTPAYPSLGVWLRASPSGGNISNLHFYSSDTTATQNRRPKLTVNYLLPCGATAPSVPLGVTLTLNPVADGYMTSAAPGDSFGNATVLNAFDNGTDIRRALLRFDLSGIPVAQALQSATLRLQSSGVANASTTAKTISAYALVEGWTEGTTSSPGTAMSWKFRDGALPWVLMYRATGSAMAIEEVTGFSPPPPSFTSGALAWNVKGLAQEWVDGITPNNGVILISTVKDNFTFGSREALAAQRPQLVITY